MWNETGNIFVDVATARYWAWEISRNVQMCSCLASSHIGLILGKVNYH